MSNKVAIILINYQDYAERFLGDCLGSLKKINYSDEYKIFIVDNESSERSFEFIQKTVETQNLASVQIIRNQNNDGFAKGNNDAMKIALDRGYDYIYLLNMDTAVEPDFLTKAVEAMECNSECNTEFNPPNPQYLGETEIGAVQSRLMLWQDKEIINSLGNATHFLGFGYCIGYNEKYNSPNPLYQGGFKEICYPSGAAVLFKAEVLKKIGLFDEQYWMYNEDQDLGWRVWLAGYKCLLAQDSIVYHKYEFSRSITKYYWMDRNRIINIIKHYRLATLFLILPAWILMELGMTFFSFKNGWFKDKLRVWAYFFNPKNIIYLLRARKQSSQIRKVKDRDIVKMFSGNISYQEIDSPLLRLGNIFFSLYWKIAKFIIRW